MGWRKAIQQSIDTCTRGTQAGLQGIPLLNQGVYLGRQQSIGALQFLVSYQQAFNTLCNLFDLGRVRHRGFIVGFCIRSDSIACQINA